MQVNFFKNNKFRQELFDKALLSYKKENKISWTRNIVRTNMEVLAIDSQGIKDIVKAIPKGLEKEFFGNVKFNYYESTIVYGKLLNRLKSYKEIEKHLLPYANIIDNWASCDCLSFDLIGEDKNALFDFAARYTKDKKPFIRRIAFRIMFGYIEKDYLSKIFDIISSLFAEKEYYVNMIISWLLCEMFIKYKEETLQYITTAKLNSFVKNKFVSKCQDSFRVSQDDKRMLKTLKN